MSGRRTAVLLLQMGGPESMAAIRPFLYNLFTDRALIPLPGPAPVRRALARLISALRSRKVADRYRAIGGGSPLGRITAGQARDLESWLAGHGMAATVRPVMRYTPPRASEAAAELKRAGAERVIALSLYPHYSRTTTGSSLADLREALEAAGGLPLEVIDRWGDHPDYHELLARRITREATSLAEEAGGEVTVLFSAHGLPEKVILSGDPYRDEVERTAAAVGALLGGVPWKLSFQSRLGPVRWIGPDTGSAIGGLAAAGARGLVAVPLSFVSDHIETLWDLDIVYRDLARELGLRYRRVPAFNTSPDFIAFLGKMVLARGEGLAAPASRLT